MAKPSTGFNDLKANNFIPKDPAKRIPVGAQAAHIAAVAGETPAGGVGAAQGAFDTSANRDTFIATVAEMKTKLNALIAAAEAFGITADS